MTSMKHFIIDLIIRINRNKKLQNYIVCYHNTISRHVNLYAYIYYDNNNNIGCIMMIAKLLST